MAEKERIIIIMSIYLVGFESGINIYKHVLKKQGRRNVKNVSRTSLLMRWS